jgi:hypothetical protein
MKKISFILVAAMLLIAGNLFANAAITTTDPSKSLSTQIGALLDDNPFIVEGADLVADVRFTLNEKGEIVVLNVKSNDPTLESFVKARLNYHKVDMPGFREGSLYIVPVRITG